MFDERTIVPESLRERVLSILHSAHQGVVSICLRAEQAVFWPNIARDLEEVRNKCNTCNKIAPSQSNLPPVEPLVPDYPFQHVCADYLSLNGEIDGVFCRPIQLMAGGDTRYSRNELYEVFGKAVRKLWMSQDPDHRRSSKPHSK